jgi:hypothetical protein
MITMSVAILALLGWLVLIVFAIVPKRLTLTEMVFLYFVIGILTITLFTILDTNVQWATVSRSVEGSFAMYICRFVVIPLLILLSVIVLHSHMKAKWRWAIVAVILLVLCGADRIYLWTGILTYIKWNEFYSALMYGAFIVMIWWIARWFLALEKGESKRTWM